MELDTTVLLVDGDVAHPDFPKRLGVTNSPGLLDLLTRDDLDVGDVLVRTNIENLTHHARRRAPSTGHRAAGERADGHRCCASFRPAIPDRIIVFDSPPLLATTEARVLATHMGQIVMVVAADQHAPASGQSCAVDHRELRCRADGAEQGRQDRRRQPITGTTGMMRRPRNPTFGRGIATGTRVRRALRMRRSSRGRNVASRSHWRLPQRLRRSAAWRADLEVRSVDRAAGNGNEQRRPRRLRTSGHPIGHPGHAGVVIQRAGRAHHDRRGRFRSRSCSTHAPAAKTTASIRRSICWGT